MAASYRFGTAVRTHSQLIPILTGQRVPAFICPSDERSGNPFFDNRGDAAGSFSPGPWNPTKVQGLWYPVSIGPTQPDGCDFCTDASRCCLGCSWGTWGAGTYPACVDPKAKIGQSAGMFVRYPTAYKFSQVTDGLSKTVMAGETIPAHNVFNGLYCLNFPVASHSIPINTMESDNGNPTKYRLVTRLRVQELPSGRRPLCDGRRERAVYR